MSLRMSLLNDELDPPFEIIEPEHWRGPVLFNSPHSGRVYPREFLKCSRLDLPTLRRSEDSFVDDLAQGVVLRGYPLMRAHFPRCYVDVNREPYELDPRMFEGRLPSFANTRSMRVAGGLGTVARVVGDAQEIYDQRISVDDALRRIETLYASLITARCAGCSPRCTASSAPRCWSIAIRCRRRPVRATSGRAPMWCWATATARAASRWCRRWSRPRCARAATR